MADEMQRLALKFGYNGSAFYGYQRQPGVRTVEGDIISACLGMHAFESAEGADFASASRTDRGVHALGNVVAFNTHFNPDELIDGLNAKCRNILFHSYLDVSATFSPRRARMRQYRYLFYDNIDRERLNSAFSHFVGQRDFKNFSKSGSKGRYRSIDRILISEGDGCLLIDFYGRSFLHNMIRRVVAAAQALANGLVEEDDVLRALNGEGSKSFGLAPPQYLILMDVDYGMTFRPVPLKGESAVRWSESMNTSRALAVLEGMLAARGSMT